MDCLTRPCLVNPHVCMLPGYASLLDRIEDMLKQIGNTELESPESVLRSKVCKVNTTLQIYNLPESSRTWGQRNLRCRAGTAAMAILQVQQYACITTPRVTIQSPLSDA